MTAEQSSDLTVVQSAELTVEQSPEMTVEQLEEWCLFYLDKHSVSGATPNQTLLFTRFNTIFLSELTI